MRRLLFVCLAAPLAAQTPHARWDSAHIAWRNGDYLTALAGFERLLGSPNSSSFVEPVALLTGELYRTIAVSPDGDNVRWSADGRFATYTTNGGRVTHVVAFEGDTARTVARLDGVGLVFSPRGDRVAYFVVPGTPELAAARAVSDSLTRVGASGARVRQQRLIVQRLERQVARVMLRDIRSGQERELTVPDLAKTDLEFTADGRSLFFVGAARGDSARSDVYLIEDVDGAPRTRALTEGPGLKQSPLAAGDFVIYSIGTAGIAVRNVATGATRTFTGGSPAVSADGSVLAWVTRPRDTVNTREPNSISVLSLHGDMTPIVVKTTARPLATPVPSPDGKRIAYAMQLFDDWEIYVVGANGQGDVRITREIQHDRFPQWVDSNRVLAIKGEARHSRSHVYDVSTGKEQRLHHNNTIRTVAPEYAWAVSPDGSKVLIVADRDGDTISPDRGLYLVDLTKPLTKDDILERLRRNRVAEQALRDKGRKMFALIEARVRPAVRDVSVARVFEYEKALYEFDSKHITQPGNRKAIDYIVATLKSFGYEAELQWFEPRPGVRTANVIATLRGSSYPDLIYVVSSHFDSVAGGPGADDDSSGSAALLEAARVLARRPQAATIKFAWFTGEEAGLLGSREFVRRAVADKLQIVGALNNDMLGWANDERLDNTIRYSNAAIRDLQHAAAFLFTDLITYDARYYRSTDAAAYYEAFGDIVGGIGSYPILGNPHYHQPHDILETINHRLVAEVSRATVASIMLLASHRTLPRAD